jgi:ATP-dependent RNA helicase DDX1
MGLAISLVAGRGGKGEKVWYHSKCADRGRGCTNTKLLADGGCTVWYDEPRLLEGVTRRLQLKDAIPRMTVAPGGLGPKGTPLPYAFALPADIAALGAVYGEERGEKQGPSEHVEAIRGQVSTLAALEVRAQNAYLALKMMRFGSTAGSGSGGAAANR